MTDKLPDNFIRTGVKTHFALPVIRGSPVLPNAAGN